MGVNFCIIQKTQVYWSVYFVQIRNKQKTTKSKNNKHETCAKFEQNLFK